MNNRKNVLVFIHGMITATSPTTHTGQYQSFFNALGSKRPQLKDAFEDPIFVEWGHETPSSGPDLRPDEKLTRAQNAVHALVNYDEVRRTRNSNNKLIRDWSLVFFLRGIFRQIKENTLLFGLADASYYSSPDGEEAVREAIYGQVLEELKGYQDNDVNLHVIAHSLGCTVAFDFLYGLFAPSTNWESRRPDFASNPTYGD